MNSYLLAIKDKNEVFKEETNQMYLHENAANNYLNSIYGENEYKRLSTIELAIKGYIVISVSNSYIMLILPDKLNEDQKMYLINSKDYLKENINKLSIINIKKIDNDYVNEDYFGDKLKENIDIIFDNKTKEKSKILYKK